MDDDTEADDNGLRQHLLHDLQSISSSLASRQSRSPLSDAEIPLLIDVVDLPRKPEPAGNDAVPGIAQRDDMRDVMEIEAERIVDELMDEFLPQLEARLRERLDARRRELARSSMRDMERGQ